jgi:hypothetical protein
MRKFIGLSGIVLMAVAALGCSPPQREAGRAGSTTGSKVDKGGTWVDNAIQSGDKDPEDADTNPYKYYSGPGADEVKPPAPASGR